MNYLFTKQNNKIKILATKTNQSGVCFNSNGEKRSVVLIPWDKRTNETVAMKLNNKQYYIGSTSLVQWKVHHRYYQSGRLVHEYYKVEFDGYDFTVTKSNSYLSGRDYNDKSGLFVNGMTNYTFPRSQGNGTIELSFSYNGTTNVNVTKQIPLNFNWDSYIYDSAKLEFDGYAFDSKGGFYCICTEALPYRTYDSEIEYDYNQMLCYCENLEDNSPFVILNSHVDHPVIEWEMSDSTFSDNALLTVYNDETGQHYPTRRVQYNQGVVVGEGSIPDDWMYFGPSTNFCWHEGEGYWKDSNGNLHNEYPDQGDCYFFYSPFTDAYYMLKPDVFDTNDHIEVYKRNGKTLPLYPSFDGFSKISLPMDIWGKVYGFSAVPSYHSQTKL